MHPYDEDFYHQSGGVQYAVLPVELRDSPPDPVANPVTFESKTVDPGELMGSDLLGSWYPLFGIDNHCFKLGDQVFEVMEDEDDDYRSSMKGLMTRSGAGLIFFNQPVAFVHLIKNPSVEGMNSFEGWSLMDSDGHQWVIFGTDNADDYYPTFIFRYEPKAPTEAP